METKGDSSLLFLISLIFLVLYLNVDSVNLGLFFLLSCVDELLTPTSFIAVFAGDGTATFTFAGVPILVGVVLSVLVVDWVFNCVCWAGLEGRSWRVRVSAVFLSKLEVNLLLTGCKSVLVCAACCRYHSVRLFNCLDCKVGCWKFINPVRYYQMMVCTTTTMPFSSKYVLTCKVSTRFF